MVNTEKKIQSQIAKEFFSFQNEMELVRSTVTSWHNNEFATSNDRLYAIFAKLYAIWETLTDSDYANTEKRKWIESVVSKKGVSLPKKPTIHQLLINYAFFDESVDYKQQQKRISTYTRILKIATATDDIYSDNIAEWISKSGGIENIRQKSTKSAITKKERVSNGKKLLSNVKSIGKISTKETKANATKSEEVVLLLGIQNSDGSISVRHTIYEKNDVSSISGKTAIETALCNVFSTHNELQKKKTIYNKAENDAKAKTNTINDIVAAELENKEICKNKIKEAA